MNTDYQLSHVIISSVPWVLSRTITIHWMPLCMVHDEDAELQSSLGIHRKSAIEHQPLLWYPKLTIQVPCTRFAYNLHIPPTYSILYCTT